MAAVTRSRQGAEPRRAGVVVVRAARPGEGTRIAALWRELWDAHEAWGGYPGSHDPRVYEQLAARLDQDARVRAGQSVLGRHIHLVASLHGELVGQVEGWFERHGVDPSTPYTCEVRSLIVTAQARGTGTGRALLDALAATARELGRGMNVVLAAEVLEPNPAHGFYARVGYAPIAWSARIEARDAGPPPMGASARIGEPRDALAIALLESTLAARRRAVGDTRFDRPRAVDATFVGAIAAHLSRTDPARADDASAPAEPLELVVTDTRAAIRGAASFAVSSLEPPFIPIKRAMIGRFALDPAVTPWPLLGPLVALGCRHALIRGAASVELTDLTAPGTPLYEAALGAGARPWSRIVMLRA